MGLRMLPAVEPVVFRGAHRVARRRCTTDLKWTIEGAHLIPPRGPVILASNHISYLDPLALAYLADRRHRRVRFLAKAELFDKKPARAAAAAASHQIPVRAELTVGRGRRSTPRSTRSTRRVRHRLPRRHDLARPRADGGEVGHGAARRGAAAVPVTPVGLWGAHRILFKGRKPDWRWGVAETAVVGAPVRIAPDEDVHDATDRIMAAIATCVARAREIYPQRPGPGDDGWWVRAPETARLRPARRTEGAEAAT